MGKVESVKDQKGSDVPNTVTQRERRLGAKGECTTSHRGEIRIGGGAGNPKGKADKKGGGG